MYLMDGVKEVKREMIFKNGKVVWFLHWFSIFLVISNSILEVISNVIFENNPYYFNFMFKFLFIFGLTLLFLSLFLRLIIKIPTNRYKYTVYLEDKVNMEKFSNEFEIIKDKGESCYVVIKRKELEYEEY